MRNLQNINIRYGSGVPVPVTRVPVTRAVTRRGKIRKIEKKKDE